MQLAAELEKRTTGRTVYILDEPTTVLHLEDIRKLFKVINGPVDKGNSVIVIEHNPNVIKTSDWIAGPKAAPAVGHPGRRVHPKLSRRFRRATPACSSPRCSRAGRSRHRIEPRKGRASV